MLERFHLEEVSQIDVDQAYAVYFTTSSPFTLEDADLFERLTGGKTIDQSLKESEVSRSDLSYLTLAAEFTKEEGELLCLTLSPTGSYEDGDSDFDPCDICVDQEDVVAWLKAYAAEHPEEDLPSVVQALHIGNEND